MIDLADTAAVAAYGHDARDAALLDAIARAMHDIVPDDFVRALDTLDRAVSTSDAKRTKRGVGWIGRMLGEDIQAQADGAQLRARMGVLLADARREAERVQAADDRLAALQGELAAVIDRLQANVAAGHGFLDAQSAQSQDADSPIERFRRRLVHLSTVAASHRVTLEHLAVSRAQCARLIERHAAVHELLGPVWTQHRIATRDR